VGLFERMMGSQAERKVVLYSSPTCLDCQAAKRFFTLHDVEMKVKDVSEEAVRREMEGTFGRVATPAIVVGKRVFWGFEENAQDIADSLGIGTGGEAPVAQKERA